MNSLNPNAVECRAHEQRRIQPEDAAATAASAKPAEPEPAVEARQVESSELLDSTGRLFIRHRGEQYQLRQTRADKLILTKVDVQRKE